MVREFKYKSNNGEVKNRKVFVMHESEDVFDGIELSYLSEDEQSAVLEKLANHVIGPMRAHGEEAKTIDGYNPAWNKAWRRFSKSKIVADESSE